MEDLQSAFKYLSPKLKCWTHKSRLKYSGGGRALHSIKIADAVDNRTIPGTGIGIGI